MGQHSIRINDQFRVRSRRVDGNAEDVEIVDYHEQETAMSKKLPAIHTGEITGHAADSRHEFARAPAGERRGYGSAAGARGPGRLGGVIHFAKDKSDNEHA